MSVASPCQNFQYHPFIQIQQRNMNQGHVFCISKKDFFLLRRNVVFHTLLESFTLQMESYLRITAGLNLSLQVMKVSRSHDVLQAICSSRKQKRVLTLAKRRMHFNMDHYFRNHDVIYLLIISSLCFNFLISFQFLVPASKDVFQQSYFRALVSICSCCVGRIR